MSRDSMTMAGPLTSGCLQREHRRRLLASLQDTAKPEWGFKPLSFIAVTHLPFNLFRLKHFQNNSIPWDWQFSFLHSCLLTPKQIILNKHNAGGKIFTCPAAVRGYTPPQHQTQERRNYDETRSSALKRWRRWRHRDPGCSDPSNHGKERCLGGQRQAEIRRRTA